MTYNLSDLLTYGNDTLLNSLKDRIRILQLLKFFYKSAQNAIEAFYLKRFNEFDAQVSENLCQIRAYQLTNVLDECDDVYLKTLSPLYQNAQDAWVKCDSLYNEYSILSKKRPSHYSNLIDRNITLELMLQDCGLDTDISDLSYLLIQQHILSKYKLVGEYNISSGIDYDNLCFDLDISSKTFARKVVHRLQRNISKSSCQFIFKLCSHLNMSQYNLFLLQALYFQDGVGRHVLSCYEATKVILRHALLTNKYIKIIATRINGNTENQVTFFLKPSRQGSYVLAKNEIEIADDGLTTFVGISSDGKYSKETNKEYISRFISIGFENIILANMAQHPQYAGLHLDDKKFNPYLKIDSIGLHKPYIDHIKESEKEFLRHKWLSSKIGCAQGNSDLFLLTHVRCDNMVFQTDTAKDKKEAWWLKYWNLHREKSYLSQEVFAYE